MINTNKYFSSTQSNESKSTKEAIAVTISETSIPQSFAICKYNHEFDNQPRPASYTWPEFCEFFGTHQKKSNKKRSPCWSPSRYKTEATRGNENVVDVSMAVIDIDDGEPVESLIKQISGYTYLIHSSYSHTQEKPKYRAILPLDKPIDAAEWTEAWLRINAWIGGINDASTKDSSRLYFIPLCPLDSVNHFVQIGDGKLLNISDLPELPVAVKKDLSQSKLWKAPIQIDGIESTPPDALGSEAQLEAMQNRCNFIKWASTPEHQPLVSEPLWQAMLSNQCRFEGGVEVAHEASCHHSGYDENATDRKIERCLNSSAPITCNRIKELGFEGCPSGGCKLPSGIATKSPAGLGVWANKKAAGSDDIAKAVLAGSIPEDLESYIEQYHTAGLQFVNGSFYGYLKGYWPRLDEQADMRRSIASYLGRNASPIKINTLLTLSKDFFSSKEQDVAPDLNLICLQNGTLDVEKGELIDFNPDHHLTYKSDIHWDANAKCDRWLQFLNEIFESDADKAEKIAFLKTWFGYCLVPDSRQHKFVWMIGGGGNGKGVLLAILTKLLGDSNVSDSHIEDLGDKHVRANLEGKLVNISSEMNAEATLPDGYLKSIVAGDRIAAERKYQDPFSFKPFVRLIGATNHLPRLRDFSEGFARRAIILSFNQKFTDENKDPELEARLTAELPGILTWAVEGLKELRASGKFAIPPLSLVALAQYKEESDPVGMFATECLTKSEAGGLQPAEIYSGYRDWCLRSGFSPMNKVRFGKRLSDLGYAKRRSGGKDYWLVIPVEGNGFIRYDGITFSPTVTPYDSNVINLANQQYRL